MRPEPVPALKGKDAERFLKAIQKPSSSEDYALFEKAEEVFKSIKRVK